MYVYIYICPYAHACNMDILYTVLRCIKYIYIYTYTYTYILYISIIGIKKQWFAQPTLLDEQKCQIFCLWKTTETVLLHDPWKDSVMLKGQTHVIFRASENLRTRKIVSWVPMLVSHITSQNMTGSLFQTSHLFPCYLEFFDGPDGFPYPSDGFFHNTRIGPPPHPPPVPFARETRSDRGPPGGG